MMRTPAASRRVLPWLVLGLLALSCAYAACRGPIRAWAGMDGKDFTVFYTATRAWTAGEDPYDRSTLARHARASGIRLNPAWSLNPPTTFVVLAPLAALPWAVAEKADVVLNTALHLGCVLLAVRVAGLRWSERRSLVLVAFGIALAPFHTAISEGQLTVVATALVLASLLAIESGHAIVAGAAVALAAGLRVQGAAVFLVPLLAQARWRALAAAAVTVGVVGAIAIARLELAGIDWAASLPASLEASGLADASRPTTQRLNAQALLNALLPGSSAAVLDVVTWLGGAAAGLALLLALRGRADHEALLLAYAGCGVLTLLTVYNRSYGATALLLPLAWAFARDRGPGTRGSAITIGIACAAFLVPGAAALATIRLPADLAWVTGQPWWPFLQVHQVIALLVVIAAILVAAVRGAGAGRRKRPALTARRPGVVEGPAPRHVPHSNDLAEAGAAPAGVRGRPAPNAMIPRAARRGRIEV